MTTSPRPRLDTTPDGLQRLYFRIVLATVALALVVNVLLRLVLGTGGMISPPQMALFGGILLISWLGHELARDRQEPAKEPMGICLMLVGLLLVLLCAETGSLESPYSMLVVVTCVFGALIVRPAKAFLLTAALATTYGFSAWLYGDEGGAIAGGLAGLRRAIMGGEHMTTERVTALMVHFLFLFVGTWIAMRLAGGFREQVTRLESDATRDPLTGLPNRRGFTEKLGLEIERAIQWDWPIAILVIDLDHFKRVNDRFGHPIGDEVLAAAAGLLREAAGPLDHLARLGGEEFAVAAVGADPRHGGDLADRIVRSFRTYEWERIVSDLEVRCSVGVAVLQPGRETPHEVDLGDLIDTADRALLQVKQNGRDGYLIAGDTPPGGTLGLPIPPGGGRPPQIIRGS